MATTTRADLLITLTSNSESTPLLLLPGTLCNEQLFKPQIDYFASERQVFIGDISRSDSISGIAKQVLDRAPKKFALAGLSMGGIIAFEIMRQAPQRVERLALLDTNPGAERDNFVSSRQEQMQAVTENGIQALLSLVNTFYFPRYVAASRLGDETLKACVLAMAEETGTETFQNQWQALLDRPDSWDSLESISCPTLVLCGDEDALCTPQIHKDMAAKIKGAHLEIIAGCGHLSTLEKPDQVNQALERWLIS